MNKIVYFILFGTLVIVFSCICANEGRKGYQIKEEKKISRMIGMDDIPTEKIQHEHYIARKGKRPAVVIAYVVEQKENILLYVSEVCYSIYGEVFKSPTLDFVL